jgi:O-antigen biosynthesis protein
VTAACAAMRRDTFVEIGGFSEALPANFNDVDLCYKVRQAGLRIVYVASVELYHFESRSRERAVHDWERNLVRGRWGIPLDDPYVPGLRRIRPAKNGRGARDGAGNGASGGRAKGRA